MLYGNQANGYGGVNTFLSQLRGMICASHHTKERAIKRGAHPTQVWDKSWKTKTGEDGIMPLMATYVFSPQNVLFTKLGKTDRQGKK